MLSAGIQLGPCDCVTDIDCFGGRIKSKALDGYISRGGMDAGHAQGQSEPAEQLRPNWIYFSDFHDRFSFGPEMSVAKENVRAGQKQRNRGANDYQNPITKSDARSEDRFPGNSEMLRGDEKSSLLNS